MPDASPNVPDRSEAPTHLTPPATQLVYREPIELFKLEQSLAYADTPERQFAILSLIITRELAQALAVEPPPGGPGTPDYARWEDDMNQMRTLDKKFEEREIPVPRFPQVRPLTGKADAEYDIRIDGDSPISTVLGPHLPGFIEVLMRNRLQAAFQKASRPLWGWHLKIRRVLARWGVWDMGSEFVAGLSAYTDADADRALSSARRYTDRIGGQEAGAVASMEATEDEVISDDDDGGDDEDPVFR